MVTFFQATFVLATFVHKSNVSAVTKLGLKNFWVQIKHIFAKHNFKSYCRPKSCICLKLRQMSSKDYVIFCGREGRGEGGN